jgi:hypothetical protein
MPVRVMLDANSKELDKVKIKIGGLCIFFLPFQAA